MSDAMTTSEVVRFWAFVKIDPDACWIWRGVKSDGYGQMKVRGKMRSAHRLSYEHYVGPIPDGYQIDHVRDRGCTSRACVRPAHLEAVTCRENLLRGDTLAAAQVARTHCPAGHPYEGHNLIMERGARVCRACKNARARRRYHARKEHTTA